MPYRPLPTPTPRASFSSDASCSYRPSHESHRSTTSLQLDTSSARGLDKQQSADFRPLPPVPGTISPPHLRLKTSSSLSALRPLPLTPPHITSASAAPRLHTSTSFSMDSAIIAGNPRSELNSDWSSARSEPLTSAALEHRRRRKLRLHLGDSTPPQMYSSRQGSLEILSEGSSDTAYSDDGDDSDLLMDFDEPEPLSPLSAKKRRLWKLRRQLGQSVPPELVYGSDVALVKCMANAFGTRKSRASYEWEEDSGFGEDETSDDESEVSLADPGTTPKQASFIKHTDGHAEFVGGWYREQRGRRWKAESDCHDVISALRKL
ncbi:hypothetical protein FIBSPDRAFT_883870 [Athelia psychrophila]|uniref:Uncharacterized protein n=1 Tax=Athelia psychrophila TaxID=1759441 RepID=A0A166TLG5_9AGAM|nr:hypothetical protein FIBSPDRAFT_883870 [Fibularhizoctonia sp. CBS 109695]